MVDRRKKPGGPALSPLLAGPVECVAHSSPDRAHQIVECGILLFVVSAGADGVTLREYEKLLQDRLPVLHREIHTRAYRAQPSRRVYRVCVSTCFSGVVLG